jgi:CheY-like chemotaxis protein
MQVSTRQYEGTGLGLALVKKFVSLHGGKCGSKAKLEKDRHFHSTAFECAKIPEICLNDSAAPEKMVQPVSEKTDRDENLKPEINNKTAILEIMPEIIEPSGDSGEKNLVMVVEDDEMSRELLTITLSEAGYRVAAVSSGREALLLARELKPSVITLDIMLPGLSGWDILKNLKHDSATSDIPILVISMNDERKLQHFVGVHLTI